MGGRGQTSYAVTQTQPAGEREPGRHHGDHVAGGKRSRLRVGDYTRQQVNISGRRSWIEQPRSSRETSLPSLLQFIFHEPGNHHCVFYMALVSFYAGMHRVAEAW